MASDPIPMTIAEEYLQNLLVKLPRFARLEKSKQRHELRGIVEESNERVDDIRQHLARCLNRQAHFLGMERGLQLQYIHHLHVFFHMSPCFDCSTLWPVLFQFPKLSEYIYTTRPGRGYDSTSLGNWFIWNSQRRDPHHRGQEDELLPPPYSPYSP
ncbi:hypothetical protein K445DRAFT_14942 [Daldinia sp. EC12]|nr:hypothetical protein F4774DRAFT_413239 [Daldinia eschscholtzii]OTB12237.1 hypothetical protein K445DRAFT_14942 [Daldinia sp. EC12]